MGLKPQKYHGVLFVCERNNKKEPTRTVSSPGETESMNCAVQQHVITLRREISTGITGTLFTTNIERINSLNI